MVMKNWRSKKYIICIGKELWNDEWQQRIHPAQFLEEDVNGKEPHLGGQHDG